MALLNKDVKKKPLPTRQAAGGQVSAQRPAHASWRSPCAAACPDGHDARAWLPIVAQREKLGLELADALDRAAAGALAGNPFPAVMGRICEAPCEAQCNRKEKDGAVSVRASERWIGDWALQRKLPAPRAATPAPRAGRVAVVGAGPAGLAAAFHLARRGHAVTLFEAEARPGGALRARPASELPPALLDAEIGRILDLGVTLRASTPVRDLATLDGARGEFDEVCVATGAADGAADGAFRARPGGDTTAHALAEGRRVAAEIDAALCGAPAAAVPAARVVGPGQVKRAAFEPAARAEPARRSAEELAADPAAEVEQR